MKREERQKNIESRIIQAILQRLAEKDFDDMTASEIAKAAGVSKRTLYKYFSSKNVMYLGLVKYCFNEVALLIKNKLQNDSIEEPLEIINCIGTIYLDYSLGNPVKGKVITSYNEQNYIISYPQYVKEISQIANSFEPTNMINLLYNKYDIKSKVKTETMAMFIWSNIVGLSTLILSKGSWIKGYYNIDERELVSENMKIIESILLGKIINERV